MERDTYTDDLDGLIKTYADFDELIRLLKLNHNVHDVGYTKLGSQDLRLLIMGSKLLLEREAYGVVTNDPESLQRPIAFARHIGATVEMSKPDEIAEHGGFALIIFRPPSAQ
jgi:hypothetical protein